MWRSHPKTKFGGKFKSAYRKHKNQLHIGQNELKTIKSAKEMLGMMQKQCIQYKKDEN